MVQFTVKVLGHTTLAIDLENNAFFKSYIEAAKKPHKWFVVCQCKTELKAKTSLKILKYLPRSKYVFPQ